MKLYLPDPPGIEIDGGSIEIRRRKTLALLAYLAISGELQRRDTLAMLLWPAANQSQARATLTRHLYESRRIHGQS